MAWTFGDFRLDPERFQLSRGDRPVRLEPQVLCLLIHLVRNRDRMVTKDEIVAAVWQGQAVSDASISSRIRSARQAVGDDGARQAVIRTVHGRGFRFVAEVSDLAARACGFGDGDHHPPDHPGGRPSIAVLPFRAARHVAGARHPGRRDPARDHRGTVAAAMACGDRARLVLPLPAGRGDLDLVSTALAARYVLSGIIESPDRTIAVTLELTDTSSREILWADRLVAPVDEIGDLRARIVAHLVSALETHIPFNEARIARLSDPDGAGRLGELSRRPWSSLPFHGSGHGTCAGLFRTSGQRGSAYLRAPMRDFPSPAFSTLSCA